MSFSENDALQNNSVKTEWCCLFTFLPNVNLPSVILLIVVLPVTSASILASMEGKKGGQMT